MLAQHKCCKSLCGHEWESTHGPDHTVCPKCKSLYVYWLNYYSWKWITFNLSYNIKTRKYYQGEEEILDSDLPIRKVVG